MRRRATFLIVAGLALLIGSPIVWWYLQPPATVGEVLPAAVPPQEPEVVVGEPRSELQPDRTRRFLEAPEGAHPLGIVIPSIGVDNPVIEVGLNADGSMEIPHDVQEIGWYTPTGVRPGDPGSAVMAGHVDSRTQGRGAFFDLRLLDVGDEIVVHTESGEQRWQVTGRTNYPKDYLPIAEIFTFEGDPRLVLITCGGPFDSDTRHYTENVVVYATPAPSS
jgi:sortase (surface protein transpeptidase)